MKDTVNLINCPVCETRLQKLRELDNWKLARRFIIGVMIEGKCTRCSNKERRKI